MEVIKNLLIRFRQSGILILIGFFLIIYIAFGFVYWQQSSEQKELEEQSAKIALIVARKLPSRAELQAKYDEANRVLTMTDVESSDDEDIATDAKAIAKLVGIAEKSGIDTDSDKLRIPSAAVREEKVGGGTYQVFSFKNISVQGDYDSVMAFISDLDSGTTQETKTMVLKRVNIRQIEVEVIREEPETEPGAEPEPETEPEPEPEPEIVIETVATLDVDLYTKLGGDGT